MRLTRRLFVQGAALALLTIDGPELLQAKESGQGVFEITRPLMGTAARITVLGRSENRIRAAIEQAFARMHAIDRLLSVFRQDSEISRLNRYGYYEGLSPETVFVLERAAHYAAISGGSFDISVLPLLAADSQESARERVNYQNILLEGRNVRFLKKGMGITLGGIGIGYAVDAAVETLQRFNLGHALINVGGDIRAIGRKGNNRSWRVGLEGPGQAGQIVAPIELNNRAVATSGNYKRRHIMNPQTGTYPETPLTATIIAPSALAADALSTAVLVLGAEKGMALINNTDGVEGLLITREHRLLKSAGHFA